jgi:hypothetical protein
MVLEQPKTKFSVCIGYVVPEPGVCLIRRMAFIKVIADYVNEKRFRPVFTNSVPSPNQIFAEGGA